MAYNSLNCQSCNAQITIGFDCPACGTTPDWDSFFGVKNAERPARPAGQPGAPERPPVPKPVRFSGLPPIPWWMRVLSVVTAFISMIGLIVMGLGALNWGMYGKESAFWMGVGLVLAFPAAIIVMFVYFSTRPD